MKTLSLLSLSALLLVSCTSPQLATSAGDHFFLEGTQAYINKEFFQERLKQTSIDTHDLDGNTILHLACGAKYHPNPESINKVTSCPPIV